MSSRVVPTALQRQNDERQPYELVSHADGGRSGISLQSLHSSCQQLIAVEWVGVMESTPVKPASGTGKQKRATTQSLDNDKYRIKGMRRPLAPKLVLGARTPVSDNA